MYLPFLLAYAFLTTSVLAKYCQNFSVPVTVHARNGIFNVPPLRDNQDASTFFANFTKPGGNFSNEILLGYQTINKTYDISVKFCRPDTGYGRNSSVQFLTHGIGFDKTLVNPNSATFSLYCACAIALAALYATWTVLTGRP